MTETLVGSCADYPHLTGCTDVQFDTPNCVFASGASSGTTCYDTCPDINAKTCSTTSVSTSCILPTYSLNSVNLCIPTSMARYSGRMYLPPAPGVTPVSKLISVGELTERGELIRNTSKIFRLISQFFQQEEMQHVLARVTKHLLLQLQFVSKRCPLLPY